MTTWYPVRVASVIEETKLDKSFVLDVPPQLDEAFRWRAGQHLVVQRTLAGERHRRCYSLSAPPGRAPRITIRKIKGGRVSQDLHENVGVGDLLDVSTPCGAFLLDAEPKAYRTHYFFAAGSGITPILSMIGTVLEREKYSRAHLLYGNRHLDQILFRAELEHTLKQYSDRFSLTHTLTSPPWLTSFDGWNGRIDAKATHRFVEQHPPVAQNAQYWICGPGSMNQTVRQALMSIDVPPERIHAENFGSPGKPSGGLSDVPVQGKRATLDLTLEGRRSQVTIEAGETLLEAMLRSQLPAPHTCTAGVCGSCLARLVRGRVHQKASFALDATDIEEGLVLTCQAVAMSDEIELRYES